MNFISKNFMYFFIVFILLLEYVITQDCDIFEKALDSFNSVFTKNDDIIDTFRRQNVTNCCDYEQLECEIINNESHITKINFNDLRYRKIRSEVLDELSNLSYLTTLEINKVDGITESITKLISLKVLIYKSQKFLQIPEKIKHLSNLEVLDFSDSIIDQSMPETICDLKNLNTFNLRNCHIKGTIPKCFENMDKLENLDLNNNQLTGTVPLIPNIKKCDYEQTNLCNLKNSKCKSNGNICSEENEMNDPGSADFKKTFGISVTYIARGVVFILGLFFICILIGFITLCTIIRKRHRNLKKYELNNQNNQNQKQYNIKVNENSTSSAENSTPLSSENSTPLSPENSTPLSPLLNSYIASFSQNANTLNNSDNRNVSNIPSTSNNNNFAVPGNSQFPLPEQVPLETSFLPSAPPPSATNYFTNNVKDTSSTNDLPPPYSEKNNI